ncbi:MAG TPA: T9SS type A sorting domain-containing protein [Saprospiraceae bacterium]|nr:T9SS type A sorting domain-containing protein [Saprospiraceae bacterium]
MYQKNLFFFVFLVVANFAAAQNSLLIPDTLSGTNINLTLQLGTHQFLNGNITNTMGANGNILGPTLIFQQGDSVDIKVDNQIGETTTIHWHGMHVSPENDGGPHTVIPANTVWNPSFKVLDKAATFWYHPHLHEHTNEHVSKGIAGMIIVRDAEEAALSLPRKYGVDDFPLVIQTKDFDNNNQIIVPSNADDIAMVNATIDPKLEVPAQVVRLRLLNGSSMRVFNVGLSNNTTFYQIASDGGLLKKAIALTRLQLAPGERAEILIDFSTLNGQTIFLKSYASELPDGIYGATNPGMMPMISLDNYKPNPLNGSDFNLLQFDVVAATANPITAIPTNLVDLNPIPEASADITRNFIFSPKIRGRNQLNGDFLINDVSFNIDVINYRIPLGNTEIWSVRNQSAIAHPFHIHDIQFYILDRNGAAPVPSEQGLKDVVLIRPMETVRVITKFEDFTNNTVPYMYHCHMLYHEDGGMMGQFLVIDMTSPTNELDKLAISIFPNPTTDIIQLKGLPLSTIKLYNCAGQLLAKRENTKETEEFSLKTYPAGFYYFNVTTNNLISTYKVIKE